MLLTWCRLAKGLCVCVCVALGWWCCGVERKVEGG